MILTGGLVKAIVYRRLGSPADSPSATWNLRPTGGICPTTDVCISVDTAGPGPFQPHILAKLSQFPARRLAGMTGWYL